MEFLTSVSSKFAPVLRMVEQYPVDCGIAVIGMVAAVAIGARRSSVKEVVTRDIWIRNTCPASPELVEPLQELRKPPQFENGSGVL